MRRRKEAQLVGVSACALLTALAAGDVRSEGVDRTAVGATPIRATLSAPIIAASGPAVKASAEQGTISILTTAPVKGGGGGILASTSGAGAVALNIGALVVGGASDGSPQSVSGLDAAKAHRNTHDGEAILLRDSIGDAIKTVTADGANSVNVLGGDITSFSASAVNAIATGAGAVKVRTAPSTTITTIWSQSPPAIAAWSHAGPVSVITDGAVKAAGQGIFAYSDFGAVDIVSKRDTSTQGPAALTAITRTGAARVITGSGTTRSPLLYAVTSAAPTVGAYGHDIESVSTSGPASAIVGDHVRMVSGMPGVERTGNVIALDMLGSKDVGGAPTAHVVIGNDDKFVLRGNNSPAIDAQVGRVGLYGPGGTASAAAEIGDGVSIHVSGLSDTGVLGLATDPDEAAPHYIGKGNVSIRVGAGSIRVDEDGATGQASGLKTNIGVGGVSAGGDVRVDNAAAVDVHGGQDRTVGLEARTAGIGAATVRSSGAVSSDNGDAILAKAADGAASVTVSRGAIAAANGDGVDVVSTGAGPATIQTSAATTITSTPNPWGIAVHATSKSGPVRIVSNGLVTAANEDVTGQSASGPVSVIVNHDVAAVGGAAITAITLGASPASIVTGSGTAKAPLHVTVQHTTSDLQVVSGLGAASALVGDYNVIVTGQPGGTREANVAAVGVMTTADQSGTPSAKIVTGMHDRFELRGNNSAAISAQIGRSGIQGPSGTASTSVSVGDDVSVHVSGLSNSGIVGFVVDRDSGHPVYGGTGGVNVAVGSGSVVVDELDATGPLTGSKTNVGVGAESQGGDVIVDDAAAVTVSGGQDFTLGLEAKTVGAGRATIKSRAAVTSNAGDGILAQTADGAMLVDVLAGDVSAPAGSASRLTAGGAGAVTLRVASGASLKGQAGVTASSATGGVSLTNAGLIQGGDGEGVALNASSPGLVVENAASGVIAGRIIGADHVSLHNAGLWRTRGANDFGTAAGSATNQVTNLGVVAVGQADGPSVTEFSNLGSFANGSATATGVLSMVNHQPGAVLNVHAPFVGAPGHSVLTLNASLRASGSTADVMNLTAGSSGRTLLRIANSGGSDEAPDPKGVVLVTGATSDADFALDPDQPNFDARAQGIRRGGAVYRLTFDNHNVVLVGAPEALASR
jgi:hypothetical protein